MLVWLVYDVLIHLKFRLYKVYNKIEYYIYNSFWLSSNNQMCTHTAGESLFVLQSEENKSHQSAEIACTSISNN